MPRYRITVARDVPEYADLIVDAPTEEAAEALVTRFFVNVSRGDEDAACALSNTLPWSSGETQNERIVDLVDDDTNKGDYYPADLTASEEAK
jgi:hypothetical protein